MTDPVAAQYEALPYPPRDPRDEAKRLVIGSPSHLLEIDHIGFGGRLNRHGPFRALVAGGGTGDAAVMLGQQCADAGMDRAEIVYLDRSAAARAVAEARAKVRGLTNIRFETASLLDLDATRFGTFDYVDCCGVLHHLPDPAAGLSALAGVLGPNGAMGLMVYGALGRTGVYHVQHILRALSLPGEPPAARIALARRLLAQLPATNWFKRNPFVTDHASAGDAGLYDLLLHAQDRAFTVEEIGALLDSAGLRLLSFVPSARYAPETYLSDAALLKRVRHEAPLDRAAIAERLAGNMKSHAFYATHRGNAVAPAAPDSPSDVPSLFDIDGAALARSLPSGGALALSIDGLKVRFPLPRLAAAMIALIDGRRTLGEIHAGLSVRAGPLDWPRFLEEFRQLHAALHGAGKLFLRKAA